MADQITGNEFKELLSERPVGTVSASKIIAISDPTTGFTSKTTCASAKAYFNEGFDAWDVLNPFYFTAIPASTTTIATSIDVSTLFNVGDVLRIVLTDSKVRYCLVTNIAPTLVTINFEQLTADIASIEYKQGNNAGLTPDGRYIPNADIYQRASNRPLRCVTIGGGGVVPSNQYGTDVYYIAPHEPVVGHVVSAVAYVGNLDSTAAETFEIKLDGVTQSMTFTCNATSIVPTTVNVDKLRTYFDTALILNLTTAANSKNTEYIYWELLIYATND